jgi:hypothetical protein
MSVAEVIAFPPVSARAKRAVAREDGERGRILLFTGVRYERLRDEPDEASHDDLRVCLRDDEIWS